MNSAWEKLRGLSSANDSGNGKTKDQLEGLSEGPNLAMVGHGRYRGAS